MNTQFTKPVPRPTACPQCRGRIIDTLAKVITVDTCWRCRECEATWTVASLATKAVSGGMIASEYTGALVRRMG